MAAQPDDRFVIRARAFEPAYMALYRSGALQQRVEEALAQLAACDVCPRDCGVDRAAGRFATCKTGRYAVVASFHPHQGEEDPLRGWRGSGTIFFSWCNLRCVFCQNSDISQGGSGDETPPDALANIMLRLQDLGCHNINFVTPEHVVPQVLEALLIAIEKGLRLPLVYNTSAYDSLDSLRLLDGVIDIYMPDFKFWDETLAMRYLQARDYPESARRAIIEMQRQVGDLMLDEKGLAKRGVLLRHLVMPGFLQDTASIMRFLAHDVSRDMYINLMNQYHPAGKVDDNHYKEINRRLLDKEFQRARHAAEKAGLWRFDERNKSANTLHW